MDEKELIEEWAKKSNSTPSVRDNHKEVNDSRWVTFLEVFFILSLIAGIGGGLYLVYSDHFKSNFSSSSTCEPTTICSNVTIPSCPVCPTLSCPSCNPQLNLTLNLNNRTC